MSGVISGAVSLQLLSDLALGTNDAGKLLKLLFFFKKKKVHALQNWAPPRKESFTNSCTSECLLCVSI